MGKATANVSAILKPLLAVIIPHVNRHLFEENLIRVAPAPILTRLKRFNDRMAGQVGMLGGMLILRVVAATYMPTGLTQAQVNPAISHLHAFLTTICARGHGVNLSNMLTVLTHAILNFLIIVVNDGNLGFRPQ
jgi:hypothetical protein